MATDINSHKAKHGRVRDVASLIHRLTCAETSGPIPLLVVRVRDLQRLARREGRVAAVKLERKSLRSFVAAATRLLRASDALIHDGESEDFIAALFSPTRNAGSVATPMDCRATLARLATAIEDGGALRVDTGWTMVDGVNSKEQLAYVIDRALERGAQERERYAFFSTIGHELRTPLTSVRGYLETLIEGGLSPEVTQKFLGVALAEADRMGRLIDGMFELSVLDLLAETGGVESCGISASVNTAIDAVTPMAALRNVSVRFLPGEHCDVAIGADRLVQILINLIDNAVKHGRSGGNVEISHSTLARRHAEIRIDDDGPGVDASERESIFSLAKRGSNVVARGSGIGLAIVRLMAERIGGEVDVIESHLGGSQFRVRLPTANIA